MNVNQKHFLGYLYFINTYADCLAILQVFMLYKNKEEALKIIKLVYPRNHYTTHVRYQNGVPIDCLQKKLLY